MWSNPSYFIGGHYLQVKLVFPTFHPISYAPLQKCWINHMAALIKKKPNPIRFKWHTPKWRILVFWLNSSLPVMVPLCPTISLGNLGRKSWNPGHCSDANTEVEGHENVFAKFRGFESHPRGPWQPHPVPCWEQELASSEGPACRVSRLWPSPSFPAACLKHNE